MGADGVIQVLEWLFRAAAQFRPALVISAGFCGALVPDAVVGDLVLGTEVLDLQGRAWSVSPAPEFRGGLQGVRLHHGRLLSVPAVVTEPAEKRRLGDQRAALAVDMETAAVAEFCTRLAVPFACLRAISDNYDTHLSPQLHGLLQSDRVSTLRVLLALIRRPAMIGELCRLARDSRLAARHLAQGLEQLLPSCQVALR
jgi:adenosylhomocysteine nucleosidase